jgi:integrase
MLAANPLLGRCYGMTKATVILTRALVDAAAPRDKPYRIWDARVPGLFLRVQPSGARLWNVQWAWQKSKSLGRYPIVTLDMARTRALAILAEAAEGTPEFAKPAPPAPVDLTLRDFIDKHYKPIVLDTKRAGDATAAALAAQFGYLYDYRLRDLTSRDFDAFRAKRLKSIDKRTKKSIKPSTINRDLDRIRAALNQAVAWRMIDENPAAKIERCVVGDDRVRFLSPDEERRLRAALDQRERRRRGARRRTNAWNAARGHEERDEWADDEFTDYLAPMTLLAMNTGLRRGELLGLRWESISLPGRVLTVTAATAKSQQQRHVQLNSEACAVLAKWKRDVAARGLVFPGPDGQRMGNIRKAWEALVRSAKIVDFRFHDLRHHFASRLVMSGVDLNTTRELLGHADIDMTTRYAHLSADHKAAAVESIVAGGEQAAGRAAEAQKLIDAIGDEAQLRALMQQLSDKLA